MKYEVFVHYSGSYNCEVEAESESEAKELAKEMFFDDDEYPDLCIERYSVYKMEEEEEE